MWPADRRKELSILDEILNECLRINSANCIVDRLVKIERLATVLTETNFEYLRPSFETFLKDEATRDGILH